MRKVTFVILVATVALLSTSCKKDIINLPEQIIGKWTTAKSQVDPVLTNNKDVITFFSTTKASVSVSLDAGQEMGELWLVEKPVDVEIKGNKAILTNRIDDHTTIVTELEVSTIGNGEMIANRTITKTVDGSVVQSLNQDVRYVQVNVGYGQAILGTWEGRCTSTGSAFDDGEIHRWEYKADGSYVYYVKEGDNWIPDESDELHQYFVDGDLLFTRWTSYGQEFRENWDIAINGNIMNWSAYRQFNDGTSNVVTFEMTKVEQP